MIMSKIGHVYLIASKKKVILDWARKLEDEVPMDTICMELCRRLRGQVSASFIRQCLDEKYKQEVRVRNAKRQRKKRKGN
jgi:hypothetical protein